MIIPDINLLVYAHDSRSRQHAAAKSWWEGLMNGTEAVGLPWAVILGFVRITTNRRILDNPLDVAGACRRVRSWLARPQVILIEPGVRHADLFFRMLESAGTAGNLTTDAHLAALTIEHQAKLHSTDADMVRFSGLKWLNPLR
ncbi:MAG: type II toxin-antitoxin system VapC family toxin [Gammaproteobacteria bacterium]|nr:type II toxin-antitoxin system VapC family toxin [Gammaproteobacteria bacterium]MXW45760.1 type II toxin-antitoxin system VapC family toxin [Gammaproteobacteria bacterium]MYD03124.1 type II toxin-antitoxin system VapC family toxin [Gammaproteobacteria bacterium]MYI25747.1 type II toxin-antitoxin system VapC family toxin [Gammaproteobacteria bacterium]